DRGAGGPPRRLRARPCRHRADARGGRLDVDPRRAARDRLMAMLGLGLWKVVLAIVIVDWTRFAPGVRGEGLAVREREFVEAARAIGLPPLRVMAEELLPNLVPLIIVLSSLEMAIAVGVEALLSFVGLGVQAGTPSWGAMIAEGRGYLMVSWWGMGVPMFALIVAVVGFNLLGGGLRRRLGPRLPTAA